MAADYRPLKFSEGVERIIGDERAIVRLGYPWWLRPFLMRGVIAITLGRRVFLSGALTERSAEYLDRLLRHELAHVRQVNRHGLFGFLTRYVAEFVKHLLATRSVNAAYDRISFEVEARAEEESL
jgi:Domain of unknown function (DUF4157)